MVALETPANRSWLYQPSFPPQWKRHQLYSLARWVNGLAFRDFQFSSSGRPIIKIAEIKDGLSGQTKFTEQTFDEDVLVTSGDMLFSWSGQPETSIDVFWWRGPQGWLNQHVFKVTPTAEVDPTFFFYLLRYLKPNFIGIARNKQTTGLGHVTKRDLENIEVAIPPLAEQKTIATLLGMLDDKIELNRRMNATLEAMARALFQSWFLDFDPVRAKLDGRQPTGLDPATAALFPSEFEDSELGPIPKGWHVGKLGEVATNPRRTVRAHEIASGTPYIALEHMPRRSIALSEWDKSADVTSGKFAFCKGEVLFGKLRPYFHKVGVAPLDGVCSTDILVITPKAPEWFGFVLGHVSSDELVNFTDLASTGTKMPRTNWTDIASFAVVVPPEGIAAALTRLVAPITELMISNARASRTLGSSRDLLLPELLTGRLVASTARD
jgi:type I restriction enzyme, S subunit